MMKNETTETRLARLHTRIRLSRFIRTEVWGAIAPSGVLVAAAGALLDSLIGNGLNPLPVLYPEGVGLTEEELRVWASDWSFRPLPDGSWLLVTLPERLGDDWAPLAHISKPTETGCGSVPEITWF